jgi:dolichol-phosphate mannosyltransferase
MIVNAGSTNQTEATAAMNAPAGAAAVQPPALVPSLDLSIIIPALNEGPNLALLLPKIRAVVEDLGVRWEILIVTRDADPQMLAAAEKAHARVLEQQERGYGGALVTAFRAARGAYLLTLDADLSHTPEFIRNLWGARTVAEILVASRYITGGTAQMPATRYVLSRVLNLFFGFGLSLPIRDLSSGFRLYKAEVIRHQQLAARDFDILEEILVRTYAEGWQALEVPFHYTPRRQGSSNARVFPFGLAYLRTFRSLWKLRNSILCADYDARAYQSRNPLQRYWQRRRFQHITELIRGQGAVLDVGCGSSRIISALPAGSVALDVLLRKLRYARRFGKALVQGSGFALPFPDGAFPCVLCSQVIEHVPKESPILDELCRVLAPGGRLVLGTPDYANWQWVMIERLYGWAVPGAYADEHISHYSRRELIEWFERRGFKLEAVRYILQSELIVALRKAR